MYTHSHTHTHNVHDNVFYTLPLKHISIYANNNYSHKNITSHTHTINAQRTQHIKRGNIYQLYNAVSKYVLYIYIYCRKVNVTHASCCM